MDLHLQQIGNYKRFIELKALDYATMYDTLLSEDETTKGGTLTNEQRAVFSQRFNYWNRKPVDILKDILKHYENLEITAIEESIEEEGTEGLAIAV